MPTFSADWLRDYIIYTSQQIKPQLTDEVVEYLTKEYVDIRQKYNPDKLAESQYAATGRASEVVGSSITPRNLEGFYRTSIALARMEHSSVVRLYHAKIAIELFLSSLRSISEAIGDEGVIDPGLVQSGARSVREKDPWRNPDYKEYVRVRMFFKHLFIEEKNSPIVKNELLDLIVEEVLMWSPGSTKERAEITAEKIFNNMESKGRLIQERGDNHYVYKK